MSLLPYLRGHRARPNPWEPTGRLFTVEEGRVYTLAGLHVTGSAAGEEARLLRDVVTLRVGAAYGRAAVAEDVARIKVDQVVAGLTPPSDDDAGTAPGSETSEEDGGD